MLIAFDKFCIFHLLTQLFVFLQRSESIEGSKLTNTIQNDDFMKGDLVLEKGETLKGKIENELAPFAIKLDILNATVYENIELITFIMGRQKQLQEKLLLQDQN